MIRCSAHLAISPVLAAFLVLFALPALLLTGAPAFAGEEVTVDGRLHVRNPADPPNGVQRIVLEELWRIDEDSDLLLGLPTRVTVDAQRNVFILDAQLNHVHVYSIEGEFLATLSREGEGPGEMQNPSDMTVDEDGNVGIVQEYPGKVVCFDRNGAPLPTLYPCGPQEKGGWCVLMNGRTRAGQRVYTGIQEINDENNRRLKNLFMTGLEADGSRRHNYLAVEQPDRPPGGKMIERDLLQPFQLAWDIGPDGRVFTAARWEQYEIFVFGTDGRFERIIEREYEPWRRTDEEKQSILNHFGAGGPGAPPFELGDIAPTISIFQGGIQVTDDGELWVHPSRGNRALPDGVLARFDVFDLQGHFRRQVEVECPGDPWNDRLLFVADDYVIRTRRFVDALITSLGPGALPEDAEEQAPAVICYRIKR